jgi:hypothetical protein
MASERSNPLILRRVAAHTLRLARAAWKGAIAEPDEKHTREAFRSCVLASKALRSAARATPKEEARRMLSEAKRLDAAAEEMKARLVRVVEGAE